MKHYKIWIACLCLLTVGCKGNKNQTRLVEKHLNSSVLALEVAEEEVSEQSSSDSEVSNFHGGIGELYAPLTLEYDSIEISNNIIPFGFPLNFTVTGNIHSASQNDEFNDASFEAYLIKDDDDRTILKNSVGQLFFHNSSDVDDVVIWESEINDSFSTIINESTQGTTLVAGDYRLLLMPAQFIYQAQETIKDNKALFSEDFGLKDFNELPLIKIIDNNDKYDLKTHIHAISSGGDSSEEHKEVEVANFLIQGGDDGATSELSGFSLSVGHDLYGKQPENSSFQYKLELLIDGSWQSIDFLDSDAIENLADSEFCVDLKDHDNECTERTISHASVVLGSEDLGLHPVLTTEQLASLFYQSRAGNLENTRTTKLLFRISMLNSDNSTINDFNELNNQSELEIDALISKPPAFDSLVLSSPAAFPTNNVSVSSISNEEIVKYIDDNYTWEYKKNLFNFEKDINHKKNRKYFGKKWHIRGWNKSSANASLGFTLYPLNKSLIDASEGNKISLIKNTWAQVKAKSYARVAVLGKNYTVFNADATLKADMIKGISSEITVKNSDGILFSYMQKRFDPQDIQATLPEISISHPISPSILSAGSLGFNSEPKSEPNQNKNYSPIKELPSWATKFPSGSPTYHLPSRSLVLPKSDSVDFEKFEYKLEKSLANESMSLGILPFTFKSGATAKSSIFDDDMSFNFTPPDLSLASFDPSLNVNITPGDLLRIDAAGYAEFGLNLRFQQGPSWLNAEMHAWAKTDVKITLVANNLQLEKSVFEVDVENANFQTIFKNDLKILHSKANVNAGIWARINYDIAWQDSSLSLYNKTYMKNLFNHKLFSASTKYELSRQPW